MTMRSPAGCLAVFVALAGLASCGGGGGGAEAPGPTPSPTPSPTPPPAVQWQVSATGGSTNGGGGSVVCSADGAAPAACGRYAAGTVVVATAVPNAASDFSGWTAGPCNGSTGTACGFTVGANVALAAAFSRPVLTVQVAGVGSVTSAPAGIACGSLCSVPFDKGSAITLTADVATVLASWSGAGCTGSGACSVTLDRSQTVVATFSAGGSPGYVQQAYVKASNASGRFGGSVAMSGDTLVVGAHLESSNATGVNGNQNNFDAGNSGAVYVFTRTNGVWRQEAYLKASNTGAGDHFGYSVSISGDTLVVGAYLEDGNATGVNGNQADNSAPDSGAAYVFTRTNGVWSQQAYLKASNTGAGDGFGYSVAVSGDTVVVGAYLEDSNSRGVNGNQDDSFSGSQSGAAYVFTRTAGVWNQQAYLKASNAGGGDSFGCSVAISGDTVVIGALTESSAATGVNGDQASDGSQWSGAAYVFTRTLGVWSQQAYLKASNTNGSDSFGNSVAISGDTVVVGAYFEDSDGTGVDGNQTNRTAVMSGAAYVFTRTGGVWSQQAYLKASNTQAGDIFGTSLALHDDTLVVGARWEDSGATGVNGNQADNSIGFSGAAYVFRRTAGVWRQQAYLKASNTGAADASFGDEFGSAVAVFGNTLVVGAHQEGSNATGVNGNQSNNSAGGSGAAYVFTVP